MILVLIFQPLFLHLCEPPWFTLVKVNGKLSKDQLHINAMFVVNRNDRYSPPERVAGVVNQKAMKSHGCTKDRTSLVLGVCSCVRFAL